MKWLKRILVGLMIIFVGGFLHYFLPSRDIVQIVGTDVKRMDIGKGAWFWDSADAGTQDNATRDVRFINAVWPNGKSRVYRNEDTNWSFPPYFKFDSGNLNAEAQGLAKQNGETWVAVSHYGWRVKIVSMFPNAYRIKEVDGPKTLLIPWFNIFFLSLLAIILLGLRRLFKKFKRKHVDPVTDQIGDTLDNVQDQAADTGNAISKFFRKIFGTTK